MSYTTLSYMSNWVKEQYVGTTSQMLMRSPLWAMFRSFGQKGEKVYDQVTQKYIFNANDTLVGWIGKPSAAGALGSGWTDPNPQKFTIAAEPFYIRLGVTDQMMDAEESDRMIVQEIVRQVENLKQAFDDLCESLFLGDGTGKIASVTGSATSTTADTGNNALTAPDGFSAYYVPVNDVNRVLKGSTVSIKAAAGTQIANDCIVAGKTTQFEEGSLLVFSATDLTVAVVDGCGVFMVNDAVTTAHPHGIDEIIADDNRYPTEGEGGLDREQDQNADWRAQVFDATASGYNKMSPFQLLDQIMRRAAFNGKVKRQKLESGKYKNKPVQFVVADAAVIDMAIEQDLRGQRRFTEEYVDDLGMTVDKYRGVMLYRHPKIFSTVFGIDFSNAYAMEKPMRFTTGDGEGKNLFMKIPDTTGWACNGFFTFQIHHNRPRECFKIENIDVSGYDPARSALS